MTLFRSLSRGTTSSDSPDKASAAKDATSAAENSQTSDHPAPHVEKRRFGFSEIANLFIRLRRHQTKAAQASTGNAQAASASAASPEQAGSPAEASRPLSFPSAEPETAPRPPARVILSPPSGPTRDRVRRLTGTPYRRARSSTGSIPGSTKVKPHHTVYISGDPETHPDVLKNEVVGALHVPVEYTEHFEVKGGVNSARLLRATRKAILEIVSNGAMGASALSEES